MSDWVLMTSAVLASIQSSVKFTEHLSHWYHKDQVLLTIVLWANLWWSGLNVRNWIGHTGNVVDQGLDRLLGILDFGTELLHLGLDFKFQNSIHPWIQFLVGNIPNTDGSNSLVDVDVSWCLNLHRLGGCIVNDNVIQLGCFNHLGSVLNLKYYRSQRLFSSLIFIGFKCLKCVDDGQDCKACEADLKKDENSKQDIRARDALG